MKSLDTGVFDGERYFDVMAEYAKASPDDLLIKLTITNRGPEAATLHLLPTLWFRNSWTWGCTHEGCTLKPRMSLAGASAIVVDHDTLERFRLRSTPTSACGNLAEVAFHRQRNKSAARVRRAELVAVRERRVQRLFVKGKRMRLNPKSYGTKVGGPLSVEDSRRRFDRGPIAAVSVRAGSRCAIRRSVRAIFAQRIA